MICLPYILLLFIKAMYAYLTDFGLQYRHKCKHLKAHLWHCIKCPIIFQMDFYVACTCKLYIVHTTLMCDYMSLWLLHDYYGLIHKFSPFKDEMSMCFSADVLIVSLFVCLAVSGSTFLRQASWRTSLSSLCWKSEWWLKMMLEPLTQTTDALCVLKLSIKEEGVTKYF